MNEETPTPANARKQNESDRLILVFGSEGALRDAVSVIRNYGVIGPCPGCQAYVLPDEVCEICGTPPVELEEE